MYFYADILNMCLLKKVFAIIFMFGFSVLGFSQEQKNIVEYSIQQKKMKITKSDIILEPQINETSEEVEGYHLYVRKLPAVSSIMITETTRDPSGKSDNYAYRALEYNKINGDEIRYLNGKPLVSEGAKYSLIDSTPEKNEHFESCFHIYIPKKITYGYAWTRNEIVDIGVGTYINIRAFEKPYGDYDGGEYVDNPFMFNFETRYRKRNIEKKEVPVVLTDNYNLLANQSFKEFSDFIVYSEGPKDLIFKIRECFEDVKDFNNLDVVFAIDATGSMKNDLETLKTDLQPMLLDLFSGKKNVQVGLLFYRDYPDSFRYKNLPVKLFEFTSQIETFIKNLNSVNIRGREGGDTPEAVFEAIYASSEYYRWRLGSQKKIILIGDAEPHPTPRGLGKYSKDFVIGNCKKLDIQINAILLPSD